MKHLIQALVVGGIILFFLNYQGLFAKGFGVNLIALHPDRVIYPFTYLGAGLSFFILSYFVFRAERKTGKINFLVSLILGGLVADISSVGMLNIFEQVFVAFNQFAYHFDFWFIAYWGTPEAAFSTIIGLGFVFESMPWWRKLNLKLVFICLSLFVGGIMVWYLIGFPSETSGILIYSMNAITRISSQLVLVFLVLPFKVDIPRRASKKSHWTDVRPSALLKKEPIPGANPTGRQPDPIAETDLHSKLVESHRARSKIPQGI
jgi:hypothetical protein